MSYIINLAKNKIAISIWLYHTDLWDEIFALIKPFKSSIKLYIGLEYNSIIYSKILQDLDASNIEHQITFHNNYGADIAPFLHHLQYIEEPYVLKLHTKKSLLGINKQINWRQVLFHTFIGNRQIFYGNIQKLESHTTGMICNKNLCWNNTSTSEKQIIELCDILNIDYIKVTNGQFAAGTMFLTKKHILSKYLTKSNTDIIINRLKYEVGKIDERRNGTYSHAMERIFGYIIENEELIFDFPKYETIKIFNKETNHYYNLVIMYNNDCYLLEDINVYGKLYWDKNNIYTIEWLHQNKTNLQSYRTIGEKIITKIL